MKLADLLDLGREPRVLEVVQMDGALDDIAVASVTEAPLSLR